MAKFALPHFLVVPDTNILFTPNATLFANSTFEENWRQGTQLSELKLLMPGIVAEEILFRRHWAACKANENAAKSLGHISAVTRTKLPKLKTDQQLMKQIRVAFGQWMSDHRGQMVKTPVSRIRWGKVIEAAVWRLPPFSAYSPDKPDSEKGFRDALILETFVDVQRRHPEQHVVILTGDGLLRSATEARLKGKPNVAIYSTLSDLVSSLTLLSKNLTESFVKEIVAKAPVVFFAPNKHDTLYYVADVQGKVRQQYGDALDKPVEEPSSIGDVLWPALMQICHALLERNPRTIVAEPDYRPISDEKMFFGPTSFVASVKSRYCWVTRIEFGRIFCDERMRQMGHASLGTKLRVASFDIAWSADISADADFANCQVDEIKLAEQELRGCYSFTTERFGLDCESTAATIRSLPPPS